MATITTGQVSFVYPGPEHRINQNHLTADWDPPLLPS